MSRKKKVIIICVVILFLGSILGAIAIYRRIEKETAMRELEITAAYARVRYAFGISRDNFYFSEILRGVRYTPLQEPSPEWNRFGIWVDMYLILKLYEIRTGNHLAYETAVDYFSQEFEPDGSLRLYNNGKHPEIQAFVEWIWENFEEWTTSPSDGKPGSAFRISVSEKYFRYAGRHEDEGFEYRDFTALSPQMLDALVRAVTDPDYVLDLTSLQQQGY